MVRFAVDGVPMPKERPRLDRGGRVHTPKKTRDYEAAVRAAAYEAMAGREPISGGVRLDVGIYLPVPKSWPEHRRLDALSGGLMPTMRPDGDNCYKAVADALNGVCYRDDGQIVIGGFVKYYSERPRVEVTVEPFRPCMQIPFCEGIDSGGQ